MITATEVNGRRRTKADQQIADFAGTVNPEATRETRDTAGGHGIQACIAGCSDKSTYLGRASRKGVCKMLCTVVTSPCREERVEQ